jgi:predicted Rossmann fold nucleotide-binding protein DprA/Smf involved in DNA uptake
VDDRELMEKQVELLQEIAKWTRESALPTVRERVVRLVDTDPKKRVYEAMAEGSLSYRSLEAATGVSRAAIPTWVTEWEAQRIVTSDGGQLRALFTLRELGIPAAPAATKAERPAKKAAEG